MTWQFRGTLLWLVGATLLAFAALDNWSQRRPSLVVVGGTSRDGHAQPGEHESLLAYDLVNSGTRSVRVLGLEPC